jgi:hypothetical protein
MRALFLGLALMACGGGATATDAPLSDAELEREILNEAERIDACDSVTDCENRSFNCGSLFVDARADQSRLDELIAEYESRNPGLGCDTSCQCGVLRCEANQCVTEAGDCMEPPDDAMTVCL